MIVYDIETGPLPAEEIKRLSPPFESKLRHPGEFSIAAVKTGNLKDPNKVEAKINDAREKHAKSVEEFSSAVEKEESDYWRDVFDRAALSALTGQVLAIGFRGNAAVVLQKEFEPDNEVELLTLFWGKFLECYKMRRPMVGFNSNYFDVQFLYQRSLILSVDVPASVFDGKWLSKTFVDLLDYWRLGNRQISNKLDTISKALGIGGKPDGISGNDFAGLYLNPATKQQAIDYLLGDLDMTWNFAKRVGLNGGQASKPANQSARVLVAKQ